MKRILFAACAATLAATATAASSWCLGLSGLGPIRAGMTVEQVTAANPVADLVPKFVTTGPPPDAAATARFYQQFYGALKSEL